MEIYYICMYIYYMKIFASSNNDQLLMWNFSHLLASFWLYKKNIALNKIHIYYSNKNKTSNTKKV